MAKAGGKKLKVNIAFFRKQKLVAKSTKSALWAQVGAVDDLAMASWITGFAPPAAAISAALITQTFGFLSGFIGYYRRKLIDYQLARRILRISCRALRVASAVTAQVFTTTRFSAPASAIRALSAQYASMDG